MKSAARLLRCIEREENFMKDEVTLTLQCEICNATLVTMCNRFMNTGGIILQASLDHTCYE